MIMLVQFEINLIMYVETTKYFMFIICLKWLFAGYINFFTKYMFTVGIL